MIDARDRARHRSEAASGVRNSLRICRQLEDHGMKLASLKGMAATARLVVVSRDLSRDACRVNGCRRRHCSPPWTTGSCVSLPALLLEKATLVEGGKGRRPSIPPRCASAHCHAPINGPTGAAYVNPCRTGAQGARRRAAGQSFWTDPLIYQGGSANFIGPMR